MNDFKSGTMQKDHFVMYMEGKSNHVKRVLTDIGIKNYDDLVVDIEGNYKVYYCGPVEITEMKTFRYIEDAKAYIADETRNEETLHPEDTDNGNNHHWFEIYEDGMVDENEELRDAMFVSNQYYNK